MRNRECPAHDGPLSADPYGAGIVECEECQLRYHYPCAKIFRECAACGKTLKTKRVFTVTNGQPAAVSMKREARTRPVSRTEPAEPTRPFIRMARKPRPPSQVFPKQVPAKSPAPLKSAASAAGEGCLTTLLSIVAVVIMVGLWIILAIH